MAFPLLPGQLFLCAVAATLGKKCSTTNALESLAFSSILSYYTPMASPRPSAFEYNNFRKFLADARKALGRESKMFSKAGVCAQLGLPNTRSYFNDILNG